MATTYTKQELEESHLLLIVDSEGAYKWSACHTRAEVAGVLRGIAADIEVGDAQQEHEEELAAIASGYGA